jgi:shikimate kinase
VVLVGFMGAGKSTVGRLLAERLGVPFADSDEELTARTGRTPQEIFATEGEPAFRALERKVVAELVTKGGDRVVALGGGALEDAATRALLTDAVVVHLDVSHAAVLARVGGDTGRPMLSRPGLEQLHRNRLVVYRAAAHLSVTTDGRTPEEVVDAILAALPDLREKARAEGPPGASPDQLV